jgi:putative DNA primase/helicase
LTTKTTTNTTDIQKFIEENSTGHRYEKMIDDEVWRKGLQVNKSNTPLKSISNTVFYLQRHPELKGCIQYSTFDHETFITGKLPFCDDSRIGTSWQDADDIALSVWLARHSCPNNKNDIPQAVDLVAKENPYHPVADYLASLKWDGKERLDAWMTTYLGVESSEYSMAVGSRWMTAAVKRIFEPGCKCDYMLILEGVQGKSKSMALAALAGKWYVEDLAHVGSKDSKQQLQGAWIIEIAEIDKLGKQEAGDVKTFLTQRHDRFRPAYGRRLTKVPRQCVFAGTVNPDVYLKDETGGRRFWPVKCLQIELKDLAEARDQLWAEAVMLYKSGAPIYLETEALEYLATIEQAKRFAVDAWHFDVSKYCACKNIVFMDEILTALSVELHQRNNSHSIRINKIMRSLGYNAQRSREGGMRYTKDVLF